jgi:hypothetical protein
MPPLAPTAGALPRVAGARPVVDVSAPRTFPHLYFNRKRILVGARAAGGGASGEEVPG